MRQTSATPGLSRIYLASVRVSKARARSGSWLAGIASFCLAGAVVLGMVERVPQHAAELAFEDACVLIPRSLIPSKEAELGMFPEIVVAARAAATPPARLSEVAERKERLARTLPSESAGPQPSPVAGVHTSPLGRVEESMEARSPFIAAPLPPSRPRGLGARVRLASMRQPIEFRLADRGNNL
jgi:hypothetical protein